jgi:predicted site-specific integrase-resolvase
MVAEHTVGGHRRYDLAKLRPELFRAAEAAQRKTIGYARVSSHDQKDNGKNSCLNSIALAKAGRSRWWPISAPG